MFVTEMSYIANPTNCCAMSIKNRYQVQLDHCMDGGGIGGMSDMWRDEQGQEMSRMFQRYEGISNVTIKETRGVELWECLVYAT